MVGGAFGIGDRAVVDRVRDVIRRSRLRYVNGHHNVDADVLLVGPLIGIDPDDSRDNKVLDEYTIHE